MKRVSKIAGALLAVLLAPLFLYLVAALLLGAIPANAGWHEAGKGIRIFVRTNGVHTWIMVPIVTSEMDWRPLVPAADLRDPRQGGDYVALGYGNRQFYLDTPSWADLSAKTAFLALFGRGPSLVHADHDRDPRTDDDQRPIILDHDEYVRLVAFLRASFRLGANGRSLPLRGRGYGQSDMFYEGLGDYNAIRDCNEWTGEALRRAGVRTGLWTPFSQSIMWRLK